jgi:CheY-like chemotaxis protein
LPDGSFRVVTRILVIEDDQAIREVTARLLSAAGYEVLAADGGAQGLRLWREGGADLVLTDARMAGLDGLQVVNALRAEAPTLPVVIMSGDVKASTELLRVATGSTVGFLKKPFRREQLIGAVTAALGDKPPPDSPTP